MEEEYLHYLWKFKLLDLSNLLSVNNKTIEVIDWGMHNHNSGPDFFSGKVKIGDTIWVGNIEIHIKSSDWDLHKHYTDKAYDNVILHVVYEHDKDITTNSNRFIETIELKEVVNYTKYSQYKSFVSRPLPCLSGLSSLTSLALLGFKERMLLERLEHKSKDLLVGLKQTEYNWEEVFYQKIACSFGMKVNSLPFEILAKNTPVKILNKITELNHIEAILFGQAGFFEIDYENQEVNSWSKEYEYQKVKLDLIPLNKTIWKFSKTRPSNFPTIRIAQLARLIHAESNLFDRLIKRKASLSEIKSILDITLSEGFWVNHYTLEKESKPIKKGLGESLINSIIINTLVPFLFVYGKYKQDESYIEYSLKLLSSLKPEINNVVSKFEDKIDVDNGCDSQALLEAYTNYCTKKKCLNCNVGVALLSK
jgi:hypothetical protein